MRPALKWSLIGCGCLGSGAVALFVGSVALLVGLDAAGIYALPTPAPKPVAVATIVPTVAPPTTIPTLPPAPTDVPTVAQQPTAATPAPTATALPTAYEWVSIEEVSAAGRQRFRVAIVMPSEYSDEQLRTAFRDATNRTYRDRPSAKAVVVFGHSSRAEIGKGADLGSAWSSSDRRGWAGDGKLETLADDGKIVVNIGSAWTTRPQSRVAVDRATPH